MNDPNAVHKSAHPVGHRIRVRYRREYVARLVRKDAHGEEWRVETPGGSYVFSTGWVDVQEHCVE